MKIGLPTYFFESLESTNVYAAQLVAQKPVAEGTVIDTAYQTNGHGQKDRIWDSPEGQNITSSVILRPHWLKIQDQFLLNVMTSMAIVDTLQFWMDQSIKVKWPNDVYVNDKKISGILIQSGIQGSTLQYSIIGIGLNVLQNKWPSEVKNPTSIVLNTSDDIDLNEVKSMLFEQLEKHYQTIQKDASKLLDRYRGSLYKKDEETVFYIQGKSVKGTVRAVDDFGRLIVDTSDGPRLFEVGEISFSK